MEFNSAFKGLTGPLCPISIYGSPVTLLKFQMAPCEVIVLVILRRTVHANMSLILNGFLDTAV